MSATATHITDPANRLARLGRGVAIFLGDLALAIARSHEAQTLLSLSDEALARRGLRRDEVVPHVMGTVRG